MLFTATTFASEPPRIVDQPPEEFVQESKPAVTLPDKNSLSVSAQKERVQVDHVQFQGGTVFDLAVLSELVQPLIGKQVGKEDIVAVLRAITNQYQQAGYVLSFAFLPKQQLADGLLTITLVEGHVVQHEIVVKDEQVKQRLARYVAKIQNDKPLKKSTFERYVALIKKTPGYTFKINVPKPKTINGATTIRIEEVKSKHYDATFGVDVVDDDVQVLVGGTMQSMTSYADKLSFSTLVPDGSVEAYYALSYQQDIGTEGLRMSLSGNQFESHGDDRIFISDIPIDYEEDKKRDRFNVGLRYPLLLSKANSWWIGSNLHYLDEKSVFSLQRTDGLSNAVNIDRHLRYSALELNTQWQHQTKRSVTYLSARTKQGLAIGRNINESVQGEIKTSGSESTHFNLIDFNAAWRYLLAKQWRMEAKGHFFWSDDILPSAEQARYGGQRFGRGYTDSQAQGDRGYGAEMLLRYIKPIKSHFVKRLEPYIVIDGARSELRANGNEYKLTSIALGMDISNAKSYKVGIEYAKPLGDVAFESQDRSPIYNIHLRWHFD